MSFGGNTGIRQEPQKPLGITPKRASTHEQARPVPYFCGTGRVAATFISEPWGVSTQDVQSRVGKKKQTVGYLYFASFAALFCVGPVDKLRKIILDGEVAWDGDLERFGEDSSTITIEGRGTITFYWGTDAQTVDTDLAASGQDHSAYRGQVYAVFNGWLLGQDKTTVQNIAFEFERFPTTWAWIETLNINGDVNPVLPFVEMFTSARFGLGLSVDLLSIPDLQATAARLAEEGIGISPLITGSAPFQQLLEQVLDTVDGFLGRTSAGKRFIGLNRPAEGGDPDPVAITEAQLLDAPALEAESWDETVNQVFIRFQNSAMEWETDAVSFRETAAFADFGGLRAETITREWVTKQSIAWKIAGSICRQRSRPAVRGSIRVPFVVGYSMDPGAKFLLTYARNNLSSLPCVVKEWTHRSPEAPDITIDFVEDRSHLTVAATEVDPDDFPSPESYDLTDLAGFLPYEFPFAYTGSEEIGLSFLCARGSLVGNGAIIYKEGDPDTFTLFAEPGRLARVGNLTAAFPDSVGYADPDVRMTFELLPVDTQLPDSTLTEALDGSLLIIVGNEILRAYNPQLIGPAEWSVSVLRGAFGSVVESHADNATVWALWNPDRKIGVTPPLAIPPTTRTFKAQATGLAGSFPLEDCAEVPYSIVERARAPLAPASCSVNGSLSGAVHHSGDDVVIDWVVTGDLWESATEDTVLECRADSAVIELRSSAGVLRATFTTSGNAGPHTIPNATLTSALGGELDFQVRVYFANDGVRSIGYTGQAVDTVA